MCPKEEVSEGVFEVASEAASEPIFDGDTVRIHNETSLSEPVSEPVSELVSEPRLQCIASTTSAPEAPATEENGDSEESAM